MAGCERAEGHHKISGREHTYDAAEYLMKVHKGEGTSLDTDFTGFDSRAANSK